MAKTKVTYKGLSDVRILPAAQLKKLGAGDFDKDLEFNRRGSGRTLEIEVNEKLLEILKNDGGFEIGEAGVSATEETPAETVVDADTGQTSTRK